MNKKRSKRDVQELSSRPVMISLFQVSASTRRNASPDFLGSFATNPEGEETAD